DDRGHESGELDRHSELGGLFRRARRDLPKSGGTDQLGVWRHRSVPAAGGDRLPAAGGGPGWTVTSRTVEKVTRALPFLRETPPGGRWGASGTGEIALVCRWGGSFGQK